MTASGQRMAWLLGALLFACGGEVSTSEAGAGDRPHGAEASDAAVGGGTASGEVGVRPSAIRYTGEPGFVLRDGRTCEREPLPPGLPVWWSHCANDADCGDGQCVGTFVHECKPGFAGSFGYWDVDIERGQPCEPIRLPTRVIWPDCPEGECFQLVVGECVHNACLSDSDCPGEGRRCACDPRGNRCVDGCASDAECLPGHRCIPVPTRCTPEIGGFACTTPDDQCTPHEACEAGAYCRPWTTDRWECVNHTCR
jgi:hypothetical protein